MNISKSTKYARIEEGILYSELTGRNLPGARIMKLCSYKYPGYQFMKKYQNKTWDGYIRLAKRVNVYNPKYIIPTGLINRVINFLTKSGYNVKIVRKYQVKKHSLRINLKKTKLRDYQIEAIKSAIKRRRGIIKLPTGSGKTKVAAGLILSIRRPVLFLVGRTDLLYQTASVFSEEIGRQWVGIIGDGKKEINAITIATVQTLYKSTNLLNELIKDRYMLIIDEAHHSKSNSWYKVASCIPAVYRIGLTATPLEGEEEQLLLEAATGPIIYKTETRDLIKQGYLSKPNIIIIDLDTIPKLPKRYNYFKAYKEGIKHEKRNEYIVQISQILKNKGKVPIIISIQEISHLKSLQDIFQKTKLRVVALYGKDTSETRQRYLRLTSEGHVDVLLTSTIFDEGIDIPNIETLIIAGGGKSPIKTIQRVGRGMRTTKTKKNVIVIDFYDRCHEYLEKHSRKRISTYRSEKHKITHVPINSIEDFLNKM